MNQKSVLFIRKMNKSAFFGQLNLKHIYKVNFYPSDNDFTKALLVMLVTNMISDGSIWAKKRQDFFYTNFEKNSLNL